MAASAAGRPAPARSLVDDDPERPTRLANRLAGLAAIVVNLGSNFATGTYEVAWSLFLSSRGAGLDLIGATFAMFAVPMILLSPWAGRYVDRRGSLPVHHHRHDYAVDRGDPVHGHARRPAGHPDHPVRVGRDRHRLPSALRDRLGRPARSGGSATAQGLFGAAGTVGFILSAVIAGWLAGLRPAPAVLVLEPDRLRRPRPEPGYRRPGDPWPGRAQDDGSPGPRAWRKVSWGPVL